MKSFFGSSCCGDHSYEELLRVIMEEAMSSHSGEELCFRLERDRLSDGLGLRLADLRDPEAWEVMSVETGFIKEWNLDDDHVDEIMVGDFIRNVNGMECCEDMERAMASDLVLEMMIWRPHSNNVISI
eukprot:CAMPEP_0183429698 /NCGR_PEP_ID=MMETSP0370-20130417/49045_1 /TAXON_ID=268820 /ORGANISM="Peridinium aciculiferum, Strain PAER-2" /LENGTH=127 /DNA_ID=CAMNT_0025614811 /DNA_START=66 /DNA_END=449 /DNA_ORIENTATION=+